MKHLFICKEYPPAPSGGIGTYVQNIAGLLARSGEVVHVIGQLWEGAERPVEEFYSGRLIVHRIPFEDWTSLVGPGLHPAVNSRDGKSLYQSSYAPQCFSWHAAMLAERLVEAEGIDLIEAQEFEAPLYYFQLRRALGLGPKRRPPCLIHLHSPTALIAQHNDWDVHHVYFRTAKRLEDHSIAAADALLCPSQSLARDVEAQYGLPERTVQVIPYPLGDSPLLPRTMETWARGTICYVGRLEPRKGVLEWIEAAVTVGRENPVARFAFVGANVLCGNRMIGNQVLDRMIPQELKSRFVFHGPQPHWALSKYLKQARIVVIPSRWENFPNVGIEAMGSGLPVLASRTGGLVEMVEDGGTGWLTRTGGRDGLTEALRRALEMPPATLAAMGSRASLHIHRLCDPKTIVESHLAFRTEIVHQRAIHSLQLPFNLPWRKSLQEKNSERRTARDHARAGIAVVISCFNNGEALDECLSSLQHQTHKAVAVMIVDDGSTDPRTRQAVEQARRSGWCVVEKAHEGEASARNAGIHAVLREGLHPLAFTFLTPENRLHPRFVGATEAVLRHCPNVGLVSCWADEQGGYRIWAKPCPTFPDQWLSNDAVPFSAVRTEALCQACNFSSQQTAEYDGWDVFNAIMASGWAAVTVPENLGACRIEPHSTRSVTARHVRARRHAELLNRFPDLVARDAADIVLMAASDKTWAKSKDFVTSGERLTLARAAMGRPGETALHILRKVKGKVLRHARLPMSQRRGGLRNNSAVVHGYGSEEHL